MNVNEVNKVFFVNYSPGRVYMLGEKGYYEKIGERREAAAAEEGGTAAKPADGTATEPAPEEEDPIEGIDDLLDIPDLE